MKKITKHPIRITADAFRTALILSGFELYDNGEYPELEKTELNLTVFEDPDMFRKPVLLQNGEYALRRQLLPFALPKMKQEGPVKAAALGKVFDGEDQEYPAHMMIQGIISCGLNPYDLNVLWKKIVKLALGTAYEAELVKVSSAQKPADLASWGADKLTDTTLTETNVWAVSVRDPDGETFTLGHTGTLTWLGGVLLGKDPESSYAFSIDIDQAACRKFGLSSRKELFDNTDAFLSRFTDDSSSVTESFEDRCRDTLRAMGYDEGFGMKLYPDGIYKKMNMIQDEWDLNNKGVLLKEPLGSYTGLPTVLTPAIEDIISRKWAAGEASAKAFEISHIYIPRQNSSPIEKLAVSFAAYGKDTDMASFTKDVGDFLTKIGNNNHFYIPTNMAIAYQTGECRLILDEKMSYLGGNFGGVSEKAEKNFGIGTHAYMANLEILPLKNKAAEEYGYIAPELREI